MRFVDAPGLPDWLATELPFERRVYVGRDGHRIHFVDQGTGPAVVLFHGNPTWCFLWRKVIAMLLDAGVRCIAPDLLGLGLSSRLASAREHTVDRHRAAMAELLEALHIDRCVFAGQDWGGPIAAGVAALAPARAGGLVLGNTSITAPKRPIKGTLFHRVSNIPVLSEALFIGGGFPLNAMHRVQGDRASIGAVERRAYRWPLRRLADRATPLALARMVPTREGHPSLAALDEIEAWARRFDGPVGLVWGRRDPLLGRLLARHQRIWPDAEVAETQAGHFSQEEVPSDWARVILHVIARGKD